jgi:isoleucyl-tRNA synthetase
MDGSNSSETHKVTSYQAEPSKLDLPRLEHEIIEFWEQDETFAASIRQRIEQGGEAFVFYDGPPFANGLPHYGHLLTGFVKDAVPRYQTMRGKVVERRFGWDCHGLPAEMASEKELGLSGREDIEELGIDKFNDHCRALVQRTTDEWYRFVTRQARWVDFVDSYKTMDLSFMESVIWAFKRLYEKGLVYEHYRVLPYCWECETPLSNFETRQDDSYRERTDPAVTVAFHVLPEDNQEELSGDLYFLAWTTTPWTLPSNLALAVGPQITYLVIEDASSHRYVVAKDLASNYLDRFENPRIVTEVPGTRLVGRRFEPIFPFFAGWENAFKVIAADFVTVEEGTGIVQMAPGFGEDDQKACEANGIAVVCPVDDRGRFTSLVPWYQGKQVFEANQEIIDYLRENGFLIEHTPYSHSYPHCWRTDTPLIYKAVSSWFVDVTAVKQALLDKNQEIEWVPEHVKNGAFGKWLEGARDWSITRNRYWGSPIPVWKSDDPNYPRIDVYGSIAELEADFGVRLNDLHRPAIDELVRPNPDDPTGKSMMRRVPDVMDCWFESGSMPFAQLHYPFENKAKFEDNFPADFIVEYIGQTRGWFYTLHVLAVALFDQPPFKHCMAHGILLGHDGRKLSKRLKNYPDPWEVFEEIGADAMRWFLLSSSVLRGHEMILERQAIFDTVKRVINPIWNAYTFLLLYARADGSKGIVDTSSTNILDRYLLAKTRSLITKVTEAFDRFDLTSATDEIERFLDSLNNWYIRRSRDRFWSKKGTDPSIDVDKQAAYNTLHTVLVTLTKITAPLLPMLSEKIFKDITDARSVHLTDWPSPELFPADNALVDDMELIREVCSEIHSIRKACGLRARLPLRKVTIASKSPIDMEPYSELVKSEGNVKEVVVTPEFDNYARPVVSLNPQRVGPRRGPLTQQLINSVKRGEYSLVKDRLEVMGLQLEPDEFEYRLEPRDPNTSRVVASNTAVVVLDITVDEELELEGLARDFIRHIQQHRKEAGYDVTDRIRLSIAGMKPSGAISKAIKNFEDLVKDQLLATELELMGEQSGTTYADKIDINIAGESLTVSTERA